MKRLILPILILSIALISCSPQEAPKAAVKEPLTEKSSNPVVGKNIDTDEALIATGLMAAPEASRATCKVIGYNMAGNFVTFREGSNEFIVLTDDPKKEGFNAACYHKDLEPFMARGRALKAEGKSREEIFEIRGAEVKSGAIEMKAGLSLHIYSSPKALYNPETNEVEGAKWRYVVYLPWATPESTGLPLNPHAPNHPWIMDPGTHRAHIMITPIGNE